ncbi:pirin family protein [Pseudoalteromonas sp. S16_S37]|uniref:pirin family protein n=1 Tax=Pseudoalteromonas sp. S16_S37 TaxID=2720228 RepID=UPI00168079FF|nr:pirin family protein [Pseudoalteromonas sp. S16_S37]MBD1581932.1 pirin family protein [Pseudoalteromonas sp. S16_S37]
MKVIRSQKAYATKDGAGVRINRIAGFDGKSLDPYLMIDELKSDDESDYMGGFPPHPHRGIETFTYIRKGGFEHQDQMGNKKAIRSGDVQWMSTGRGVVHSEMPLVDEDNGMHGFQIWLNMPAKEKMRPPQYQDSVDTGVPKLVNSEQVELRALAGNWLMDTQSIAGAIQGLAGNGAIADVILPKHTKTVLDVSAHEKVLIYIHSGQLADSAFVAGNLLEVSPSEPLVLAASANGLGALVLAGQPINEEIAHMGPFVMNTQEQLREAVRDYQLGKFGDIV